MGLLASAGFITGEALCGIALAVPVAASGSKDVLEMFGGRFASLWQPSALFVIISLVMLYKLALRPAAPGTKKN